MTEEIKHTEQEIQEDLLSLEQDDSFVENDNQISSEEIENENIIKQESNKDKKNKARQAKVSRGRNKVLREKPEFDQKTLDVRRVTRVMSGGRRFSFHVTIVAGDRNGRVGLGTGKANDTQAAMVKAFKEAKKNMLKVPLNNKKTILHEVEAKHDAAKVWLSPNKGKGLIAGSSARIILDLLGAQNVTAKFHGGTKNKLNNARAVMKALKKLAKK